VAASKILANRIASDSTLVRHVAKGLLSSDSARKQTSREVVAFLHTHGVHETDARVAEALWALGGSKELLYEWVRAEDVVAGPRSEEMSAFWGDASGVDAAVDEDEEVLFMEEVEVMGTRLSDWERTNGAGAGGGEEEHAETERTARLRRRHAVAIGGGGDDGSGWVIATPVNQRLEPEFSD